MTQVYQLVFVIEQTHLFLPHASVDFLGDVVDLMISGGSLGSGSAHMLLIWRGAWTSRQRVALRGHHSITLSERQEQRGPAQLHKHVSCSLTSHWPESVTQPRPKTRDEVHSFHESEG